MSESTTHLRTELQALFGSVLREQLPETSHADWQRFKTAAQQWRTGELSGTAALEYVRSLSADLQGTFGRALRIDNALSDLADRVSRRLDNDYRSETERSLPECQRLASTLGARSLRPLPAKRYPPFPQVQFVFDSSEGAPTFSTDQLRAIDSIAHLLHARAAVRPSPHASKEYSIRLRAEVLLLWQSPDGAGDHRSPGGSPRSLGDVGRHGRAAALASAPLLAELNDHFANLVHIDPRFANFVPFAEVHGLWRGVDSRGHPIPPSALIASALHRQCSAFDALMDALDRLALRLPQARGLVLFGPRLDALHQRLSISNPAASAKVEREWPNQPLRQIVGQIRSRLEAAKTRAMAFAAGIGGEVGLSPGSIPDVPRESAGGPFYQSAAHLVLDLKQLHQAVGETYGGVAFAWEARRVLILAGALRFRWWPLEIQLDASEVEDAASELAMRAGILRAPLAVENEAEAAALAETLCASADRLARMLDAGSLGHKTRRVMAVLRAVAWTIRNLDPETTTAILLRDVCRASEVLCALALIKAVDIETGAPADSNLALASRVGIVIGWQDRAAPPLDPTGAIDTLWATKPFIEYVQARGGHIEMAGAGIGEAASTDLLSMLEFRAKVAKLAILAAAKGGVCTPTLRASTIEDATALLAALPRGAANQHIRLLLPAEQVESMLADPDACADAMDRSLATLTASCWVDDFAAPVSDAETALAESLTAAWTAHITKLSSLGVKPDTHTLWFEAVRGWLPLRALDAAALETSFANRPKWLDDAIRRAAQSLSRNHPKALAALAWSTWPKGCYSELYPAVEADWDHVAALLASLLGDHHTPSAPDHWTADGQWLLRLASL